MEQEWPERTGNRKMSTKSRPLAGVDGANKERSPSPHDILMLGYKVGFPTSVI